MFITLTNELRRLIACYVWPLRFSSLILYKSCSKVHVNIPIKSLWTLQFQTAMVSFNYCAIVQAPTTRLQFWTTFYLNALIESNYFLFEHHAKWVHSFSGLPPLLPYCFTTDKNYTIFDSRIISIQFCIVFNILNIQLFLRI